VQYYTKRQAFVYGLTFGIIDRRWSLERMWARHQDIFMGREVMHYKESVD
jgi:hypothetical protein